MPIAIRTVRELTVDTDKDGWIVLTQRAEDAAESDDTIEIPPEYWQAVIKTVRVLTNGD